MSAISLFATLTPYTGDEKFLTGPSPRTKAVWAKLQPYFKEETKKVFSPPAVRTHSNYNLGGKTRTV